MSHISSIPRGNLEAFQLPCLGTGPIIRTINDLRAGISDGFDETRWMLFCHELSLYVTVESLQGVPYNRLEDIHMLGLLYGFGKYNNSYSTKPEDFKRIFSPSTLKQFIIYYLHNGHLSINYQNGGFKVGMTYFDFMIDISNAFIDFFNQHFTKREADTCFDRRILYHTVVANGKFFEPNTSTPIPDVSRYVGKKVCTFKGQDITLRILEYSSEKPQESVVLSHGLALFILNNILKIINYHYTNEYTRQHCQGSTAALPAPTGQRVYYI